jgi:peptidoglycan/LPS O-acetylase OafA/YrhL
LDGARGLAVILVMLFHLHIPGLALGWAGVPLFFCLSGFLITGILISNKNKPFSEYIGNFLLNRSLRIFPLFYAYLIVNFLMLLILGKSTDGYIWFALYLQNYIIGLTGETPGLLGHTWSLAIEEQFYWLWPIAIFFIKDKFYTKTFVSLIVISMLSRIVIYNLTNHSPYMINVTLISCVDMLVLGSFFAKIKDEKNAGKISIVMAAFGIITTFYAIHSVGYSSFWSPEEWAGKCWYLFTALGMTFSPLIYLLYKLDKCGKDIFLTKLFTSKALVYTGKISYGLYMWHILCFYAVDMIFDKMGMQKSGFIWATTSLMLAFVVSTISFYAFEIHFLNLKNKRKYSQSVS